MRKTLRIVVGVAMVLGLLGPSAGASQQVAVEKSDNLKNTWNYKYDGGTELAAQGKYLYSAQMDGGEGADRGSKPESGGIHIFDVSKKKPRRVGFLHCPGNDNDVEVLRKGVIAVGHHSNRCNIPRAGGESAHGVFFVDVRNPRKPQILGGLRLPTGGSSHTIRPHPGGRYVYVNPGGLPTNGGANTHIVDAKNPKNPKIVGTFKPSNTGCHDFSFFVKGKKRLGFCTGYQESSIWDVSKPAEPVILSRIYNPLIQFMHYGTPSWDGKLLAIDDEAFAAHECHTGQSPTGRVWIYDISNPEAPTMVSSYAPPRGGDGTIGSYAGWVPSWCLSHGLDWQPKSYNLAVTWFTGGVSVLNLNDPTSPEEVAHFQAEDSSTYSALWHKNRLYTNDTVRGVDAFQISGLPKLPKK